ncbi:hypothetical protein GCM10011273_15390 [Asticcacaulis endophyticus]|uniref:Uncharacterized protein n=1 Tax=Asticcacaulis endophyticus TaxID=1395890 RepID=A0A918Q3L1_9CAUL|nr:hypothetical protein GCM10011273_15390 [Asticcacaulis endophyticus]
MLTTPNTAMASAMTANPATSARNLDRIDMKTPHTLTTIPLGIVSILIERYKCKIEVNNHGVKEVMSLKPEIKRAPQITCETLNGNSWRLYF